MKSIKIEVLCYELGDILDLGNVKSLSRRAAKEKLNNARRGVVVDVVETQRPDKISYRLLTDKWEVTYMTSAEAEKAMLIGHAKLDDLFSIFEVIKNGNKKGSSN